MRTQTVVVLLAVAAALGAAWQGLTREGAAEPPDAAAQPAPLPGQPSVPLHSQQQTWLTEARAGQAASMRRLAASLSGADTLSHVDLEAAQYWAQQASSAGDAGAAAVIARLQLHLHQARPPADAPADPPPPGPRQAHEWLLRYATSYEACQVDKRQGCFEQNRKVLTEVPRLQLAWRQVVEWPAQAAADEQLDARRAAAALLAFGLQPFGVPAASTPWRAADEPERGRAMWEELARGGALQDRLMLAYSLSEGPNPDPARAKALVKEIEQSTDARRLVEFRLALRDPPQQRGWLRRAHDRLLPALTDPTAHYLRRAADAGAFNEAQTLGLAYFFGGGFFAGMSGEQWDIASIKPDHALAQKYLQTAQASGRREAAAVLGGLWLAGHDVPQDYQRGLALLRDAGERGSLWALGSLAQIYAKGSFGVEKTPATAQALALIAQRLGAVLPPAEELLLPLDESGLEMARTALADLQDQLSPPQLARAQEMARGWAPGRTLPAAGQGRGVMHGTGVYVGAGGEMLTNAHVVAGCKTVRQTDSGEDGQVVRVDVANDLALVRFARPGASHLPLRADAPNLGEPVTVFGFPLVGPLSAAGNVTNGIVSSEAGFEDNALQFQFTAPVQSGSSGGPVLDAKGRLIGLIVGKLNAELTARVAGEAPQNANFGIKNIALAAFLRGASVDYARPAWLTHWRERAPEDLAQMARKASRRLACAP